MGFTAVTLEITKKCNHKCTFCYNVAPSTAKDVSFDQIDQVVDKISNYGIINATISGGEPYIVRDKTEYLIQKLIDRNIDVCLNTNLTLLDDDAADYIEKTLGHYNTVYSSIPSVVEEKCDGITQKRGSYRNIVHGLKICRDHHISIGLNMSVSEINIDDLDHIPSFLRDNPVDSFTLFPVIPPIHDRNNISFSNNVQNLIKVADTLLKVHEEFGIVVGSIRPLPLCVIGEDEKYNVIRGSRCTTGSKRFAIDLSTGEVEACSQENKKYGNIYLASIEEIYERMHPWRENKMLANACKGCELLEKCGGMCLWSEPCGRC